MVDEKKICFITCVNNKVIYEECLFYINSLYIPKGYEIEVICIEDSVSMCLGYNNAMKKSNAKYKIYLHQDIFIINRDFISEILSIFEENKDIGLIGVIGSEKINTNGIWRESTHCKGKIYERKLGKLDLVEYEQINNKYESVEIIDGCIMITKCDIHWNEEVFYGWNFYDIAQCIEFSKLNYEVVIPKQEKPWCIHDNESANLGNYYEEDREKFLNLYSKDIFPLVSILIPTYNRVKYFEIALESVLNQTYKNIEIIISDNSEGQETEDLLKSKYLSNYKNIKYHKNNINIGASESISRLLELATGKYVNYLMDDDIFEKTKIEKMMNYFINDKGNEISMVTSTRYVINERGEKQYIFYRFDESIKNEVVFEGIDLLKFVFGRRFNIIGEPTTVLFKKENLEERYGVYKGYLYLANMDLASWANLLMKGKCVFMVEPLSMFRIHSQQGQQNSEIMAIGAKEWINFDKDLAGLY